MNNLQPIKTDLLPEYLTQLAVIHRRISKNIGFHFF